MGVLDRFVAKLRSPEVAIFGLEHQEGMDAVNVVADQIRGGDQLLPDQRRAGIVEHFEVAVRPIDSSWYEGFFGAATDYYQVPPLPVVQLVRPDINGRFP